MNRYDHETVAPGTEIRRENMDTDDTLLPFATSLALILAAPLGGAIAGEAVVTGSATYPGSAAPPPGAVLDVLLEDVSLADAPAIVIATDTQEDLGAPPYAFSLRYDDTEIDARHVYAVRARVTLGDRLLMTTDTHAPVITRDAPMQVDVVMRRVSAPVDGTDRIRTAPGLTLPASFTGTMPMASGPGVAWHLDLWPDQVYHLRQTYGDRDSTYDRGRWHAEPARRAIVLRGGREAPVSFEILGNGDLRMMTPDGHPIVSDLPYNLTAGPLDPAEDVQFLTGMFRYMADAATFTECLTGRTYPVAMEGAYLDAERAYTRLEGREPGAPVLALLHGRLAMRPSMEGPDRTHLEIERFLRLDPDWTCATTGGYTGRQSVAELTNTYWRLSEIAGDAMTPVENRREPHLILHSEEAGGFSATVGCNMIRGAYGTEGDTLSFGDARMTRMACPPPLDAMERALMQALSRTARHRIDDTTLELLDADGERLLRAQAVYLE